jgi:hypothetical protein
MDPGQLSAIACLKSGLQEVSNPGIKRLISSVISLGVNALKKH